MKMEGIRGKILAVTIVVCSLWIGTFSFTLDAVANEVTMYDLTVTVVNGHGTVEPNSGSYSVGTVVTLTATPETGYNVVRQWTGTDDDTSCALTNTLTMDSDKTVTVEFGQRRVFVVGSEPNLVSIQYAIDEAGCGDVVMVPTGVYFEDINFNGKNIRVTSMNPEDPMLVASTIIQGTGAGPVVTFSGSESQSCMLDGLTITGGNTTGDGGGICGNGTEAMIANCIITDNHADGYGGGLSDCDGTIVRCTIAGNTASGYGGGMKNSSGGSPTLTNCIFRGNSAKFLGGGFYNDWGSPTLFNCIFIGNSARSAGGMWCGDSGNPTLINCTFSGNSASFDGGGMGNNESDPTLTNCIFWGNSDNTGVELWAQISGGDDPVVNYSCIQGLIGNFGGTGNISDDPLFVEADGADNIPGTADDNLRLLPSSPCFNTGDNSAVPPSLLTDLDGDPRIIDANVDMGAYEGPHQGFLMSSESITVPEGQTATFTVALAMDPLGTVEVTVVAESGDPDITVESGALLTFDSSDYSTPQNVTLAAAEDKDNLNSSVLVKVSGTQFLAASIKAIEQDNDLPTGNILFVDADAQGFNTGMNWSEAFTQLQDALTVAAMYPGIVTVIRVAEGTYKPDRGVGVASGDREATFQLINGLTIKGGYAGFGEPEPNDREIAKYETILSGDLNGDDIEIVYPEILLYEPTRADNSYHVLTGSGTDATAVLDGLTVLVGNANGYSGVDYDHGGGMYNYFGSPTVTNCIFKCNSANDDGGGMYNRTGLGYDSKPILTNCTFEGNAGRIGGGACNEYSSPILSKCTFRDNWARVSGGGIYNYYSSQKIIDCTFSNNSAMYGGGMYNKESSSIVISCKFHNNSAQGGGGMNNWYCDDLKVIDCTFSGNFVGVDCYGGGMSNFNSHPTLINCTFIGNSTDTASDGGAMINRYSNPNLTNCMFTGNSAERGGGMCNYDSHPTLANCVFSSNSAIFEGGGVYNWYGDLTLTNCTFCGNSAAEYGGGMFNIRGAPKLTNCMFAGNYAHFQRGNGIYNSSSKAVLSNCILWSDILQDVYVSGDIVVITYSNIQGGWPGEGNIDADPCFIHPGHWADTNDPNIIVEPNDPSAIWIDGDYHLLLDSPCIDAGDNTAVPPSVLTDLDGKQRIIGGTVDMGAYEFWGPIYVDDDGPNDPAPGDPQVSDPLENGTEGHPFDTIQEAIDLAVDWYTVLVRQGSYFEPAGGSTIDFLGKNITLKSEDPTDWDIIDNTVIRSYVQFSGTEDPNCKFAGFKIRNLEGAIYGNHTHATISHCNISGNGPCGATVIKDCHGTISNCLITDNLTFFYCGVYPVVFGCNGLIKNCTIANNLSGVSVGTATIKNCIIYNNAGAQLDVGSGELLNISYCNLQGGLEGITGGGSVNRGPGNIDTDPCFVRAGYWEGAPLELIEGDYHLRSEGWRWNTDSNSWTYDYITSRCIDAGNPGSPLDGELMSVPRDPDNTWGVNLRINMGAFGGTSQAGMPPHGWALLADLNNDGTVNFLDFAYQTQDWQATAPEQPGDQNRDGVVNMMDLGGLANDWLKKTTFFIPEPDVPDVTPPAPAPVIITIGAVSSSSIMMTASEAYDESGVQYYFEALSAGGHDSGWIGVPSYTDVNLVPDTTYCYRVKARDTSGNYNETIWSPQVCTTTISPPDTLPPLPDPMQWDDQVDANGYNGLPREILLPPYGAFDYGATMRAIVAVDQAPPGVPLSNVEYKFICTTDPRFSSGGEADCQSNPGNCPEWRNVNNVIGDPLTYTVRVGGSGAPGTLRFQVRARDTSDNHNMTDWSTPPWPAVYRDPP